MFGIKLPADEARVLGQPYRAMKERKREQALELHEQIWVNGVDHEAPREVREGIENIVASESLADLGPDAPEIMWSNYTLNDLHQMRRPAFITWGLQDQPLIERTSLKTADSLSDVHTGSIDSAAHYLNWEQPEEFNRLVLAFLDSALLEQ